MASPLNTGKQSVDLAGAAPRVSKIRREPPPVVKQKILVDSEGREQRDVILGVLTYALAIFVIIFAFGHYSGWSPTQYTVVVTAEE